MKLKNKFNPKTLQFICHGCGNDAGVGVLKDYLVYCMKCGKNIKGKKIKFKSEPTTT